MPKVKITGIEKTRYSEVRTISDELWQKYQDMCEDTTTRDSDFTDAFEHLFRCDDPVGDGITDLEIELVKDATALTSHNSQQGE